MCALGFHLEKGTPLVILFRRFRALKSYIWALGFHPEKGTPLVILFGRFRAYKKYTLGALVFILKKVHHWSAYLAVFGHIKNTQLGPLFSF